MLTAISIFFRHEPLIHFFMLAMIVFAFEYAWSWNKKEKLIVDKQTISYLKQQREDLLMRSLTLFEQQNLIKEHIENELLYREAYKRGLDKNSRMRRSLILKMRGLALKDIRKPNAKELKQYFEKNHTQYTQAPTISLTQVFYRDPKKVPTELLRQLRAGRDIKTLGESFAHNGRSIPHINAREMAAILGPNATVAIMNLPDKQWHGPIESKQGIHFVRIDQRTSAKKANFVNLKPYLEQDWLIAQSQKTLDKTVEKLRNKYRIILAPEE